MKISRLVLPILFLISACQWTQPENSRIKKIIAEKEITTKDLNLRDQVRSIIRYSISPSNKFLSKGLVLKDNPRFQSISADSVVKMIWADSIINCTSIFFNQQGKALKHIWWHDRKGKHDNRNTTIFQYDNHQNLINKEEYGTYDGHTQKLHSKETFKYNANNNLIESTYLEDNNNQLVLSTSSISYKGKDTHVKTIKIEPNSKSILDIKNTILHANGEYSRNNKGEIQTYDDQGNLIKLELSDTLNQKKDYTILFKYDKNDALIQKTVFGENETILNHENWVYDTYGNLLLTIDEWSEGSTKTHFNSEGRTLKVQDLKWKDTSIVQRTKEQQYDASNNLVASISTYDDGINPRQTSKDSIQYTYDKHQNWILKKSFKKDSLWLIERRDILYY